MTGIAYSPDGRRIFSASADQTAKLWDTATGEEMLTLRGHANGLTGLAIDRVGRRMATASWDQTIRVWDAGEQDKGP